MIGKTTTKQTRARRRAGWTAVLAGTALASAMSPSAGDAQQYGGALAVSGGHVFVGEASGTLPGIVYVYAVEDGRWTEAARLMASPEVAPPDGFGRALASEDGMVVVGAPNLERGTGEGAPAEDGEHGAAMIFEMRHGAWSETGRLTLAEARPEWEFGTAVAIGGGLALVSAPGENDGAGAVYAFVRGGGGQWSLGGRVERPAAGEPREGAGEEGRPSPAGDEGSDDADEAVGELGFGTVVALHGSTALVATRGGRGSDASVYAFSVEPGAGELAFEARLEAPGRLLGEASRFGAALATDGRRALVGAPGAGMALEYRRDAEAGTWGPGLRVMEMALPVTGFGASIALAESEAWIGAPTSRGGVGAVFRMAKDDGGEWVSLRRVAGPSSLEGRTSFGSRVAVDGDVRVVAAGGVDFRAGGVVASAGTGAGELLVGDHRGPPAILGLAEELPCEENLVGHFPCNNVSVLSFLPIKDMGGARGARLNDIWGWTDPESGREIAIVGRTDGTAFVDVTDPYNPAMLGNLPKTPGSRSSVWRDMKVYRDHAYVVADGAGAHGVQVFDLRRLRDEAGPDAVFEPDFTYDGIHSAHNIVVNEQTGFGYVVGSSGGGTTCGGGLHMLALEDPARPEFAGCFFDETTGRRRTGYSHDAQCVVYHGPDEEHRGKEICIGSNETALSVADVTDKSAPKAISMMAYPNVAYAHQGWLTDDHQFFYMNDEGDEPQGLVEGTRTLVWDLADLDEPVLAAEYVADTPDTDHNLYILGDLMYQSNYGAGLRILDISDRTDPVEIAYFDNSPYGGASWSNYPYFPSGVVVMTSTGDGLFVVRNTARRNLIP